MEFGPVVAWRIVLVGREIVAAVLVGEGADGLRLRLGIGAGSGED